MKTPFYIVLLIFVVGMVVCSGCTNRTTTPVPGTMNIITSTPQQQDNNWITATQENDNIEVAVGSVWTVTGKVSGTNGPITYTIHTIEDIRDKKNYDNPLVTKSFYPSADGTFTLKVEIDPKILPVGSYVVYLKNPDGQRVRFQFLVRAKGVDCSTLCDQVSSSKSYTEGLLYNRNGEAVCYC